MIRRVLLRDSTIRGMARAGLLVTIIAPVAGMVTSPVLAFMGFPEGASAAFGFGWIVGIAAAIFLVVVPIVCIWIQSRTTPLHGHCPHCNYDLRGNSGSGCPECGWNREAM